jgi:hypothetical protein
MAKFTSKQESEAINLLRDNKLRKARRRIREMALEGKTSSQIKKTLLWEFAGEAWLEKLLELLPLILELFKKLLG